MEVSDTSTRGVQSTITKHPLGTASTLPPTITTTKAIAEGSLASGKPIEANAVFVETLGTNLRLVKTSFRQIFFVCLYAFLCLAGSWPRYEISGAVTRLWPSHPVSSATLQWKQWNPHPSNTFLLIFRPPVWSQISQKDSLPLFPYSISHRLDHRYQPAPELTGFATLSVPPLADRKTFLYFYHNPSLFFLYCHLA